MGGVEQVIHQIARGTSALGIKTDVLSLTSGNDLQTIDIDGYTSHRAKCHLKIASTSFSATVFTKFSELAKRADIIHYHYPWPFMDVVHFITRLNKKTVLTYHSDIIRQKKLGYIYRPLQQKFLGSVDEIVSTSLNYCESSDVLARFLKKVSVIPIGIDKRTYPAPCPVRMKYWNNILGPKFFLFVGVLRYYKGLHTLLDAAKNVAYPIVIVGAGPIEQELRLKAKNLGLKNVFFLGYLSDIEKVALLTLCYGVVFPSHLRSEAFGVSLLEGAMFGKPMISTDIGTGTTFVNIENETGLVIPPDDAFALKNAMKHLWENPEIASDMGQKAASRYWINFTADKMVSSYVGLYSKLMNKFNDGKNINMFSLPVSKDII